MELIQGECLEEMRKLEAGSIDLILIDPPYNIGKDTWDKIDNYEEWMKDVFLELQRVLKDNGSFYFWHNNMPTISKLMNIIESDTNFIFRQMIVWNKRFEGSKKKGFLDGFIEVEMLRNYQKMAEYCLYYTFQDETGLSKIMGKCVNPVAEYLLSEFKKANVTISEIAKLFPSKTGGMTGCVSNWTTGKSFIMKEQYEKIRNYLNKDKEYEYLREEYEYLREEYEDLREEYEDLREEYEDLRFTFNNQKTHHSVWNYEIAKKQGHITPKPVVMMENIIKHSSKEGDVVLDCFMGSGTTGVACKNLNRDFIGIELDEGYFKIAEERISSAFTSKEKQ